MRLLRPFIVVGLVLATSACLVPDVNLEGKSCSTDHPCAEAYQCVQHVCVLPGDVPDGGNADGGSADAGHADAGFDAGLPANVGTVSGVDAFTVGYLVDDSVVLNGQGQNVTVVMSEGPPYCPAYDQQAGWVIEIDATEALSTEVFAPGAYPIMISVDGGPDVHMELKHNLADGGVDVALDSSAGAVYPGITGTVTFTSMADDYVSGSFSAVLHAFPDGGSNPLLGTFTANNSACH